MSSASDSDSLSDTNPKAIVAAAAAAAALPRSSSAAAVVPRPRKRWSLVWNDFSKERLPDGTPVAICNHCKKHLTASSRSGTTHLKNHLKICTTENRVDGRKKRRKLLVRRPHDHPDPTPTPKFNPDQSRRDLLRMVLLHQYPLTIVHDPGFRTFLRSLQPRFPPVSLDALKADCAKFYQETKLKLAETLKTLSCKVSVTVDAWKPDGGVEYMRLTCHYVDNDWKLRSKILNLASFEDAAMSKGFGRAIAEKLLEWNAHEKLFSVMLDGCFGMADEVADELLNLVHPKGVLGSDGELFHLQSYEYIVNYVVQNGLEQVSEVIDKVRECVKYLSSSPRALRRFQEVARQIHAPHKPLVLDAPNSWTSTYEMLSTACELQDALVGLAESDSECGDMLSTIEWADVKSISECLDVFSQLIKKFSSFAIPTSNLYFLDICSIHLLLKSWCTSQIPVVASMALRVFERFEQYWGMTRTVMAIASILDPRYKMKSIEYFFKLIYDGEYGNARIEDIRKHLTDIYNRYVVQSTHAPSSQGLVCYTEGTTHGCNNPHYGTDTFAKTPSRITLSEARKGFDQYLQESSSSQSSKTDLDMYLEEAVHPPIEDHDDNFNVLAWWKVNALKYPVLSMVARDILATPMAILPLDTDGRWLHSYMNSVDPMTIQSFVCAHDWLRDEVEAANLDADGCMVPANGES